MFTFVVLSRSLFSQNKKEVDESFFKLGKLLCLSAFFWATATFATSPDVDVTVTEPAILFSNSSSAYFKSASDAYSNSQSMYEGTFPIGGGTTETRTLSGMHPSSSSGTINGVPRLYLASSTSCYSNANGSHCDPATDVTVATATTAICPEDSVKVGSNTLKFALVLYSDAPDYVFKCVRTVPKDIPPKDCDAQGDPIHPSNGQQVQTETDYVSADGVLKFTRTYRSTSGSLSSMVTANLVATESLDTVLPSCYASWYTLNTATGPKIVPYCFRYRSDSIDRFKVNSALGQTLDFYSAGSGIIALDNSRELLEKYKNNLNQTEWLLTHPDGSTETYNANGKLITTLSSANKKLEYLYSDASTPTSIAPGANLLIALRDASSGRQLQFFYNANWQMIKIINPQGGEYKYAYDDFYNLISVTYPDNRVKNYFYNEAANINNGAACSGNAIGLPRAMTGFTDESGARFADLKYQCDGKAVSAEHIGGVEKSTFDYSIPNVTTVTDPLGTARNFSYTKISNVNYPIGVNQPGGSGCSASEQQKTYSTEGLLSQKTEFNGNTSLYGYGIYDLEDRRVEGLSGAASPSLLNSNSVLPIGARKISTEWNILRKPTRIAEPKKITTNIYHGQPDTFVGGIASCAPVGVTAPLLCKKVEQATTDVNGANGFSATLDTTIAKREWRYTYNDLGKPLTIIAPQNILTNTVESTYEYYSADGTSWKKGDLKKLTNALGHVTQYIAYDPNGRLLELIDANNVHQTFFYDLRGRLLSSQVDTNKTNMSYDAVGNLLKIVAPNAVEINYIYDAAHRLVAISDKLGNRIDYTLDNAGNKTNTAIRDAGGTLRYQQQKIYDALSRVQKIVDTKANAITYLYDANGNSTGVIDAKNQTTSNTFDALDQLKLTTDALSGITDYSYDKQGRITEVKDPKGHSTTYTYNAFGELTQQISPDTGTTTFTYDAAGNRTSAKDARNIVVNYGYDALNRLKSVSYPAAATENVTYTYDSIANGSYGIGRLASVSTAAARNDYEYNSKGLISKKFTQVGTLLSTTQYSYDAAGNLTGIIYPSGRSVTYVPNSQGRVQSISTKADANATTQTIAANLDYLPFGPVSSYSYGNGLTHTNSYDTDYRLTAVQVGSVLSRSYGYDANDNINAITNVIAATKNQAFGYDALDRLTSATGVYGSLGYTYDAVGNRLTETVGTTTATYNYETTSNRLLGITAPSVTRAFAYDTAGNRTQGTTEDNKVQNYTYNKANRLNTAKVGTTLVGTYAYNALGQRVSKVAGSVKEFYHYDEAGQLIAVTDTAGKYLREYIYNGSQLVSFITVANPSIPSISLTSSKATFQGSAALEKVQIGYTGTVGYVHFTGEGQASWPVTITSTASYSTTLRYSLTGTDRPLALLIDGVQKDTVSFPATANLNTWGSARVTLSLTLTAGNHTLTLKTTGSGGPNIDTVGIGAVSGQTAAPVSTLYYVHNDHQGTPQVVTNQAKAVVWMADYQPFGKLQPGQTNSIELYSRFPGQYVDSETGNYYNYFRDYDPSIGRYIESDPIGLGGGINTYAYVNGNPSSFVDPDGQNLVWAAQRAWNMGQFGGRVFNEVWEGLAGQSLGGSIYDAVREYEEAQKDQDHENYHKTCDREPPPDLSPCEMARWQYRQALSCQKKRQEWEERWGTEGSKAAHERALEQVKNRLKNAAEAIKNSCDCK